MTNRIIFSLIIIIFGFHASCQTINETIDFINKGIFESTKSLNKVLFYSKLKVDRYGKFTDELYLANGTLFETNSAYLKNLEFVKLNEIDASDYDDIQDYWVVELRCKNGYKCVERLIITQPDTPNTDVINFVVYNKQYAERIKNAIIHLLKEANIHPDFRTSDPF